MKGIEEAVIGMKKSGKRLVAIPPESQVPFQKNFVVVVEVFFIFYLLILSF